ncbi:MAG: zinc metalloprotease HtpX, partial [Candidatus Subteraquimicrobiales bacterium]|nr:zinc metalloprotease HtpX [Candidatus Subteraquimicrobiales bacterium]
MYEQIASNIRRSWLIIIIFSLFVIFLGYIFGELTEMGNSGIFFAAIIAIVMSWTSYYHSDKIVLAMSKARPVEKNEYPYLYNTVEGLSIAAGIPRPKMYVIDDSAPNAFATGRDPEHSAIAVTTGLLEKLNRLELEGVIAHEMSHIKNYDIRLATLAVVMVGIIALLSDWLRRSFWWGGRRRRDDGGQLRGILVLIGLVLAILAPLIAELMRMALSRQREFLADVSGAMLTRYPEGLASALEKLASDTEPLEVANKATAHLYIVNPLKDIGGAINNLFNTHPPIEERVEKLKG